MRRRFRVVLVRVDHTLRLQKIQRDPVVRKECTFHGLQRVRSFSSAERLAMNTGLSHVILRLSPPTHRSCRFFSHVWVVAENELQQLCLRGARRVATCSHDATVYINHWRKLSNFKPARPQRKLRHRAMPTGGPKIDSGENCFPLKVANQLASYFYTSPGPIRSVVSKQPS